MAFKENCTGCNSYLVPQKVQITPEIIKIRPYLNGFYGLVCKNCIVNAQIKYLNRVPPQDLPLLINIDWIYPKGMNQLIRERYKENGYNVQRM
jgi:hypothetical protein